MVDISRLQKATAWGQVGDCFPFKEMELDPKGPRVFKLVLDRHPNLLRTMP